MLIYVKSHVIIYVKSHVNAIFRVLSQLYTPTFYITSSSYSKTYRKGIIFHHILQDLLYLSLHDHDVREYAVNKGLSFPLRRVVLNKQLEVVEFVLICTSFRITLKVALQFIIL